MFCTWRWDHNLLCPAPPFQERMDHIALNRPGPHNRDLDDKVVKFARAQARQHVHLGSALHLKHAQRIPLAQHRIGFSILARDARQGQRALIMILQQIEAFANTGQHAQGQHIDLENAKRLYVVLIPLDKTALWHGSIANRDSFAECIFGENKAADMLAQMARHADHLLGQFEHTPQMRVAQIHARFLDMRLANAAPVRAPDGLSERSCNIS